MGGWAEVPAKTEDLVQAQLSDTSDMTYPIEQGHSDGAEDKF